jgi:hypothetical protein
MKYETTHKGFPVEIYTDDYEIIEDGIRTAQAIITTPEGRWVQPMKVSTMLMENEDEFKRFVAEDVYYSYTRNNP